MNDAALIGLRQDLAATRAAVGLHTRGTWSMRALLEHWDGWGEETILRELATRVGLRFARGHRVAVPRDDVVAIDQQLADEAAARREQHNAEQARSPMPVDDRERGRRQVQAEADRNRRGRRGRVSHA